MYDDGFQNSNSDEEDKEDKQREKELFRDDDDDNVRFNDSPASPNIESPRPTNDFQKDRTFKVNIKPHNDEDENISPWRDEEPEIPNEISPGMHRKASSNTSQGDYEVINNHTIRESLTMKNKPSEDAKMPHKSRRMRSQDTVKFAKTDKGFSEISQLNKKNLSVKVYPKL